MTQMIGLVIDEAYRLCTEVPGRIAEALSAATWSLWSMRRSTDRGSSCTPKSPIGAMS